MILFYKVENGKAILGSGAVIPDGFKKYTTGNKPKELSDAMALDNSARIAELKKLLKDSDFKVLPDYDQDNTQLKIDRQLWREEIRTLEGE